MLLFLSLGLQHDEQTLMSPKNAIARLSGADALKPFYKIVRMITMPRT
jgi:hypothetical protein